MGQDIFGQIRHQRPGDVPYLGNDGGWSVDGHPLYAYSNGVVSIGYNGLITASTLYVTATKATSHVMADFAYIQTGDGHDSGAARFLAYQIDAGGASAIRAAESHVIRSAAADTEGTWAHEFGVHSAKAGNGTNLTGGLYVASSEAGWLTAATGVRADFGLLLVGDLGFTYPIRFIDTDGSSTRFYVDQYGHVLSQSAVDTNSQISVTATGTGAAFFTAAAGTKANSIATDSSGNLTVSSDGVVADVIKMTHTGAIANSLVVGAAGAIRMAAYGIGTATFDGSGNITSVSDERKKDILGPFDGGLNEVLALDPIRYHWKEDSGLNPDDLNVGFSAQQVKDIIPEAVGMDAQGFYTFADRPVIAALVNAVKELKAEVNELRALVTA